MGLNQLLGLAANTTLPKFWSPAAFGNCKLQFSQAKQGSAQAIPNNTSAVECWALEQQNPEITTSPQASWHPKDAEFLYPYSLLTAAAEPGHSHLLLHRNNLFYCCFPLHFITSSVALRGPGIPRQAALSTFIPLSCTATPPSTHGLLKSNPAFPKPFFKGPQLHQRICLLSLNLSLSIQKPKKLPPNYRVVFSNSAF